MCLVYCLSFKISVHVCVCGKSVLTSQQFTTVAIWHTKPMVNGNIYHI